MNISFITIDRIVEEKMAADDDYRRQVERNGRPLLSHGRAMSDEALLAKLAGLGFNADRIELDATFPRFISAQALSETMIDETPSPAPDVPIDWAWIATTCLWERWRPDLPNVEMLDDRMQAGYAALKQRDVAKACRLWLEAWRAILDMMRRFGIDSLKDFDGRFGGTQSVFNWVQDLEMELHNAGIDDPQFIRERIALCKTMIDRFPDGHPPIENFKTALAQSYFELGDRDAGDRLFRRRCDDDPKRGSNWIAWSDCYWTFAAEVNKHAAKAEQVLKEGLATPGVTDRVFILERLAALYEETGREEAATLRREIEHAKASKPAAAVQRELAVDFDEKPLRRSRESVAEDLLGRKIRVGRNDACPCGSGKKFKKCCGRHGADG